jgi:hypothetical protein
MLHSICITCIQTFVLGCMQLVSGAIPQRELVRPAATCAPPSSAAARRRGMIFAGALGIPAVLLQTLDFSRSSAAVMLPRRPPPPRRRVRLSPHLAREAAIGAAMHTTAPVIKRPNLHRCAGMPSADALPARPAVTICAHVRNTQGSIKSTELGQCLGDSSGRIFTGSEPC